MKKFLHGVLITAIAAVLAGTSFQSVSAQTNPSNIKVDYVNQKLLFTATASQTFYSKIYVAKTTISIKKNKTTNTEVVTIKKAAPTEYDLKGGNATIDLSTYPVTKDTYLSIWGKWDDPILVKLPAADSKIRATVNAANTTVTIDDISNKREPRPITAPLEYCTTNGAWTDYNASSTDLSTYNALGATLRFRIKAQGSSQLLSNTVDIGNDADNNKITAYVTGIGNFASNELKVKIAKTTAGPKATFDYANHLVKIPRTCEYRTQYGGSLGNFQPAGSENSDAKTIILKAEDLLKTGSEFDIRTAAVATKPASKITEYDLMPIPEVKPQTMEGTALTSTSQDVTESRIMDPYGSLTGGKENLADFKVTKLTLDSKSASGTMTVKNGTQDTYQFIVTAPQMVNSLSDLTPPAFNAKATGTVAAGRTAAIRVKAGQFVFIRRAANARNSQWSSPCEFFGVVNNTMS